MEILQSLVHHSFNPLITEGGMAYGGKPDDCDKSYITMLMLLLQI